MYEYDILRMKANKINPQRQISKLCSVGLLIDTTALFEGLEITDWSCLQYLCSKVPIEPRVLSVKNTSRGSRGGKDVFGARAFVPDSSNVDTPQFTAHF